MQILPNSAISIKVIFEDDDIIGIDKPAGIPCLPLKDGETGTVANGIAALWPSSLPEAGIIHRLDNDTSGCLLIAKNINAYSDLKKQFEEEKILKRYTALVLGETPAEGTIDTPIMHDPRNKKKMKVLPLTPTLSPPPKSRRTGKGRGGEKGGGRGQPTLDSRSLPDTRRDESRGNDKGRSALTLYKLVKKFQNGRYSLLEVTIKTGVRHQIRVHLASIGHPIAGDRLYQNARQKSRDGTGAKRQLLHASSIGFYHPKSKKWTEIRSEPVFVEKYCSKII